MLASRVQVIESRAGSTIYVLEVVPMKRAVLALTLLVLLAAPGFAGEIPGGGKTPPPPPPPSDGSSTTTSGQANSQTQADLLTTTLIELILRIVVNP